MILRNICTRSCNFCAVATGRPTELDLGEPARVADAVAKAQSVKEKGAEIMAQLGMTPAS